MSDVSTWVEGAAGSGYDVTHLPYGVFSRGGEEPRVGVRIGDLVLDLAGLSAAWARPDAQLFQRRTLNAFMASGRGTWESTRAWLHEVLTDTGQRDEVEQFLVPLEQVSPHLPFDVADYVDFYCSLDHATNVGRIFRPDAEALMPNWRHLPVGYHGRAGTVVASGTPIVRPCGQRKPRNAEVPDYGPSARLDIEAEVGFVVGKPSPLGARVGTEAFTEHVFGVTLVNDWSARDIQAWEYVPLGPFLGKSFATSISPWVTPLAALENARVDLPGQDPEPLPYLRLGGAGGFDIDLEVELNGHVVSRPPYSSMYWSPAQMLAHMTVNGASLRAGDLFASGTVSGQDPATRGSFLELSWGGREPFKAGPDERSFLEDGDEVVLRASAPGAHGTRISLGEVRGRVDPARP